MKCEKKELCERINEKRKSFAKAARNHKRLNRILWASTAVLSVALALATNFNLKFGSISTGSIAQVLSIILPVITGYTVLRNPEPLWIFEIDFRNQLGDLLERVELVEETDEKQKLEKYENDYFEILDKANKRWLEIRQKVS